MEYGKINNVFTGGSGAGCSNGLEQVVGIVGQSANRPLDALQQGSVAATH